MLPRLTILLGDWIDALGSLPEKSVHCCVTSPPYYGLRDYDHPGQLGLEKTFQAYQRKLVYGFHKLWRVLCDDGVLWLNLGDVYARDGGEKSRINDDELQASNRGSKKARSLDRVRLGVKNKELVGLPWRIAFALQDAGWYLRTDIVWAKTNPMPESVTDRPTRAHEFIFMLTKQEKYWYDAEAIKEPVTGGAHPRTNGKNSRMINAVANLVYERNKRTVWNVAVAPYKGAHFATFPPDLIKPCIMASCPARCCPDCGTGWIRVFEERSREIDGEYNGKLAQAPKYSAGRSILRSVRAAREAGGEHDNPFTPKKTLRWVPQCHCGKEPIAGTVLDPFFGSGTTGLVAAELGRDCIGIELNPKYVTLAKERCHVTPGFNFSP